MIRTLLYSFLLLTATTSLFSQSSTYGDDMRGASGVNQVGVHAMPMSFLNSSPRLRLGGIYRTGRLGLLLDLEYGNKLLLDQRGTDNSYQFYGVRPELRLYDDNPAYSGSLQRYLGLEFSHNHFERDYSYADGSPVLMDNVRYDRVTQKRNRSALLIKVGLQKLTGSGIYFDVYTGIGAAVRTIEYVNSVNPVADDTEDKFFIPDFNELDAGRKAVVDLALGVRVGYMFTR